MVNSGVFFTLYIAAALLFPGLTFASLHKGQATVANTAIFSLILVIPLTLFLIFKLYKLKLNKKNMELLKSISSQDKVFEPENINQAIADLIDVVTVEEHYTNTELLLNHITSGLLTKYLRDNIILDDYRGVVFDAILAVNAETGKNRSIIVAVNSYKKSCATSRYNTGQLESWKFVAQGNKWFLDEISEITAIDYC